MKPRDTSHLIGRALSDPSFVYNGGRLTLAMSLLLSRPQFPYYKVELN